MKHQGSTDSPNFDRINPQECINAKLRRLHRLVNAAYQVKIRPFGLQGSMLSILFIIGKKPGINQKMIADILVLDQSTMSRDLKKLVQKNWVKISKGEDSRNSKLALTKEGLSFLETIVPVWEKMHMEVEAILGKKQIQQIDKITRAIEDRLKK